MRTRYKYRTRLRLKWSRFKLAISRSRSSSLNPTLTFLLLIPVGWLVSCTDDKYIDPSPISNKDLYLRYDYPQERIFSYRQTIDRKEYGTNTGEERLLRLECRTRSADVSGFAAIDSLLYTTSRDSRYPARLRTASSFQMHPSGAPAERKQQIMATPRPLIPLPGLPADLMPIDRKVTEDIPYRHQLTTNARIISSQRQREIHKDEVSTETTFEERVVQVVEMTHAADSTTEIPAQHTDRQIVSYDSLIYIRLITLSAPSGYLIRSKETEREIHFVPDAGTTSTGRESTGNGVNGRYTVNESVSKLELIEILASKP